MNHEAIAQYLEGKGVAVRGEDLFINAMPAQDRTGLLLRDYFGGTPIDYELPGYRKTTYMLISRAGTYIEAKTLILKAMKHLTFEGERVINGLQFKYSRPRTEPLSYPSSPAGLTEFSTNVDCAYVIL